MRYSSNKEIQDFVTQRVKEGFAFINGKKHGKLTIPGTGKSLIIPRSPSDHRALLNLKRDLRQITCAAAT